MELRRIQLREDLRRACDEGTLKLGALAPSVRELAQRYSISGNVARQALQQLIEDGTLYTVPGVGTFIGRRQTKVSEFYLRITDAASADADQSYLGFAERIAQLGGASLALPLDTAREYQQRGELPVLSGIFGPTINPGQREVPHVTFAGHVDKADAGYSDVVSYDDRDGGMQATQHLISLGHRGIAFLAVHDIGLRAASYEWSAEREIGWSRTMTMAGLSCEGLAFHPRSLLKEPMPDSFAAGRQAARLLVNRPDITAVVAANDHAALALFDVLKSAAIPLERWPAVVGFDNLASVQGQILTSLHLPSDSLGRAAADLLWQRRHGSLIGPPVHQRVPMCLLPRLTSRSGWSVLMESAAYSAPGTLATSPSPRRKRRVAGTV